MSVLQAVIHFVYETKTATAIRESDVLFPVLQTFHILGILLMVGGISVVDLRLLGLLLREQSPHDVAKPLLPVTWVGFLVMFVSGGLLFAAQSEKIYGNIFLQVKVALLLVAGLNVVVFHSTTYRSIQSWEASVVPRSAKVAGALSLLLWSAVIVTGRFIAYF